MAEPHTFDYVICGGGQSGCVLASRLSHLLPEASIALVEAGPDAHDNPVVQSALRSPELHGTELQWNDTTAPQVGANHRSIYHGGGKMLSGGTAANYGTWVRGHDVDYNRWAALVGDQNWSYESLLPHFRSSETHYHKFKDCENPQEHGFDGPVHTVASPSYPLGPTLLTALMQAGHQQIADGNSGQPLGVARWVHNWRKHGDVFVRQPAGQVYDLSRVHVITNTTVHKVVFAKKLPGQKLKVEGVDLGNGRVLSATKEVLICCGGLRTPQLLMLSGIGDFDHLNSMGVDPVLNITDVGQNLHDHCAAMLFWKLKNPEKGLAVGHPKFDTQGIAPSEWLLTETIPAETLSTALQKDGVEDIASHPNIATTRAHYEMTFGYYPAGAEPGVLPVDGSVITTGIANWLPTSRGTIRLQSADAKAAPIIDPGYLTTEHDLCVMREGIRELMRIMETPAAKTEIQGQFQLPGTHITLSSTDAEIDDFVRKVCLTWFHPAGTAAMGKVIDTDLRVKEVENLRVIDTSILPEPLAAHYQAPVYAIARKAAEIIAITA